MSFSTIIHHSFNIFDINIITLSSAFHRFSSSILIYIDSKYLFEAFSYYSAHHRIMNNNNMEQRIEQINVKPNEGFFGDIADGLAANAANQYVRDRVGGGVAGEVLGDIAERVMESGYGGGGIGGGSGGGKNKMLFYFYSQIYS
jgi:hypothetical protein